MQAIRFLRYLMILVAIVGAGAFVVTNYSWVFAKRVKGRIVNVERVTDPNAFIGSKVTPEQMHSYAILIQGDDGKLYTASSEDRKWQVAKKDYCVDALLYRYPPWDFNRANTFFNARLDELSLCAGDAAPPVIEAPGTAPAEKPKLIPPVHGN